MKLRQIQNLLSLGKTVNSEIIKNAQVYGTDRYDGNGFLTNRSNHHLCPYPMLVDPASHLNPGDILQVLETHKPNTIYGPSCILVGNDSHKPFYILQTELKRFVKFKSC